MKEDRIETHLSDFLRRMKTPSEASAKYACNGQEKPLGSAPQNEDDI